MASVQKFALNKRPYLAGPFRVVLCKNAKFQLFIYHEGPGASRGLGSKKCKKAKSKKHLTGVNYNLAFMQKVKIPTLDFSTLGPSARTLAAHRLHRPTKLHKMTHSPFEKKSKIPTFLWLGKPPQPFSSFFLVLEPKNQNSAPDIFMPCCLHSKKV